MFKYLGGDRKKIYLDIFAVGILLIIGYKYLSGFENFIDIRLYDESNYLDHGVNLIRSGFPNAQLSPLYSFWYYFLSLFQPDNVKLFYLNYELLTIILPIFIYIVLRRYHVPLISSFLISVYFLISFTNFASFPKVGHFAIVLILSSFIIASFPKNHFDKLTVGLIGSLFASYVRPEFFITFLSLLIIYVATFVNDFRSFHLRRLYKILMVVIIMVLNFSLIGIPFSSGARSFLAFSQHFSLNWVSWEKSSLSPWSRVNSDQIIQNNFADSKTIFECYEKNPHIFLKHINTNQKNLPKICASQLKHSTLIFPDNRSYNKLESLLLILTLILLVLYNVYRPGVKFISQFKNNFQSRKGLWLFIVLYCIPVLISTIVIYPREHYLTMLIILITIFTTTLIYFPEKHISNVIPNTIFLFVLGIILFIASPNMSTLKNYSDYKPNLTVINYLRSLKITGNVNVLESEGGYNIYAGSNYNRIAEYQKKSGFYDFKNGYKINMVLLGGRLQHDKRFIEDSEWLYFLKNYKKFGFIKKNVPNSGFVILLNQTLVPSL